MHEEFKKKVVVILGQTATGKSDLAVKIAKQYNGEVISADSRQVYSGLDIGTGKITKAEMKDVPHHLLDVVNPKKKFTVAEYKKLADKKIQEIITCGKVPILCGGTGFYIDAVVEGVVFPEVPPNLKLRKNLGKELAPELFKMLKKIDPARAKDIFTKNEQHNKVRLIRAIEIAIALGKVPKITEVKPMYEFIKIGLQLSEKILKEKIKTRLEKRINPPAGGGMLREAKKLHSQGLSWKRMEELGLEYKFMALHLQNKLSKQEMLEKLNSEIYKYAKRQMTWFKRDKEIKWFSPTEYKKILIFFSSKIFKNER